MSRGTTTPGVFKAMRIATLAVVAAAALVASGCLHDRRISDREDEYGTGWWNLPAFHRVVERDEGLGLHFPGFLIGVEKAWRDDICMPKLEGLEPDPLNLETLRQEPPGLSELEKDLRRDHLHNIEEFLDDWKGTFISHLVEYRMKGVGGMGLERIEEDIFFDVYAEKRGSNAEECDAKQAYETSLQAASGESLLAVQIHGNLQKAKHPYTHILVYAMGWNTDQQETIRNVNSLVTQLDKTNSNGTFKPLVVAISWPSEWKWPVGEWLGKLASYAVRTDDADEIGVLWVNLILRNILVPAKHEYGIPLILIGHSFGARMLTRAATSAELICTQCPHQPDDIDLVIGLQGAFSVNRFIPKRGFRAGREGAPYREFKDFARKMMFTWSEHDDATPLAAWVTGARHVGSEPGYILSKANRNLDRFAHFKVENNNCGKIKLKPEEGLETKTWNEAFDDDQYEVVMVDASEIVKYGAYGHWGKAHSDIFTPRIAELIWRSVKALPPRQDAGRRAHCAC